MTRKLLFLIVGILSAGGLLLLFKPADTTSKPFAAPGAKAVRPSPRPVEKKAAYLLKDGVVVSGPSSLKFEQGDHVILSVTSDRADSLHLHGYDLTLPVRPNVAADLRFVADRTGRFTLESHHSDRELMTIEIYPRGYVD